MKIFNLLTALLVVMLTVSVNAQAGTEQKKAKVKPLMERAEAGDQKAILDLGLLGDESVIPYLKKFLEQPNKNFGSAASNAQMALARLCGGEQFEEILNELKSEDPSVQTDAIKKLTYVEGPKSIRVLAKLLTDSDENKKWRVMKGYDPNKRGPQGEIPQGKVFYHPRNYLAMKALAQIVPNPPTMPTSEPTEEDLPKWREWWESNKDKYK